MLKRLSVKNLALISSLDVEFGEGLNVLTGETGAGKSIIIDSLLLLMGERYDRALLRYGAQDGFVEGVFSLPETAKTALSEFMPDADFDDDIIVLRRFFADGKSDVRINGRLSTAALLRRLASCLIDIYGQNEYVKLAKKEEQLAIIDYYARHKQEKIKKNLADLYTEYTDVANKLCDLGASDERAKNIDFIKYQLEEIASAKTYADEENELVEKRKLMLNAEKIKSSLTEAHEVLRSNAVSEAARKMRGIRDLSAEYDSLYERIESALIELDDVAESIYSEAQGFSFDEADIDRLEERLSYVRLLKKKYGDYDRMMAYCEEARERLNLLENADSIYEDLTARKDELLKKMYKLCKDLSDVRRNEGSSFADGIEKQIAQMGMANARFEVRITDFPSFDDFEAVVKPNGVDEVEFYISPNAGQPVLPLVKIISGGEMSRFMLAIKAVTSEMDSTPTLIFDEIDAGISGKVGQEVAKKLSLIARGHQVLCVTHLPQIAAFADDHYLIEKNTVGGETLTTVSKLAREGMISEISRLSGGVGISGKSESNAEEMKSWSDDYKKKL